MTSATGAGTAAAFDQTAAQLEDTTGAAPQPRILRSLAHELRQPLGSIEATAYYLDLVLPHGDQRARDHVTRLHDFVGQCSWMLACALELTNDRPLQPVLLNLEAAITQVISARAIPGQPVPELNLSGSLPLVLADPARVRTLVENLLTLFERLAVGRHRVLVHTSSAEGRVQIEIEVPVTGYQSEAALGPGSALGLESLRRGAALHDAVLAVSVSAINGVAARLSWPEAPVSHGVAQP